MYQYKGVKLPLKGLVVSELKNHNEIIDKYAEGGWRLVQIFPVKYASNGVPMEVEIIFEREIDH
ncbi:MAG: DUF4177 domain-containing protein [Tissierella sp.]|nr:DUF4177 domain-containing protein [Tissierella sp.]